MNKKIKIYSGIYKKNPGKSTDNFIMDDKAVLADNKLSYFYVLETMAHNLMLVEGQLIPKKAGKQILKTLFEILNDENTNKLVDPEIGDIHENFEHILHEQIGDNAGWMHTARSRNDQVMTDQKMYIKSKLFGIFNSLQKLNKTLLSKSEKYVTVIMPGFTHLRVATPSTFGFWWQAYLIQLLDCQKLLIDIMEVLDKNPLGAGTSYGVGWPIDTKKTTDLLGFSKPIDNALAELNSRGVYEAHIISNLTIMVLIISKMMEDIIIWSMPEIGLINIGQEYTTGSSIMPQKVNPDIAEKVKGQVGSLAGDLNNVIISIKGTPSGYNRDSASSKHAIMSALEDFDSIVKIVSEFITSIEPNKEKMIQMMKPSLATKLADFLSQEYKIPFRKSHEIVGSSIAKVNGDFSKLTISVVKQSVEKVSDTEINLNQKNLKDILDPAKALDQYSYIGSPNPKSIITVNQNLETTIGELELKTKQKKKHFEQSLDKLVNKVKNIIS